MIRLDLLCSSAGVERIQACRVKGRHCVHQHQGRGSWTAASSRFVRLDGSHAGAAAACASQILLQFCLISFNRMHISICCSCIIREIFFQFSPPYFFHGPHKILFHRLLHFPSLTVVGPLSLSLSKCKGAGPFSPNARVHIVLS